MRKLKIDWTLITIIFIAFIVGLAGGLILDNMEKQKQIEHLEFINETYRSTIELQESIIQNELDRGGDTSE